MRRRVAAVLIGRTVSSFSSLLFSFPLSLFLLLLFSEMRTRQSADVDAFVPGINLKWQMLLPVSGKQESRPTRVSQRELKISV